MKSWFQFAKNYINKTERFWYSVPWSEETKLELFGPVDQRHVWRRKSEAYSKKNTMPTVNHGGGSALLWGCFTSSGTGNLQHVEGKMDQE